MKMMICQEESENFIFVNGKEYFVNPETGELQNVLRDYSSTGKERPWRKYKIENQTVEQCYRLLEKREWNQNDWKRKADRLHECGLHLWFNVYSGENGCETMKVKYAESCRVRLCPLCSWRRSIKIQIHTRKILEQMQAEQRYSYIFVTLTVPNVSGQALSDKISEMMGAWNRLVGYRKIEKAVKGWYRGLEVTHNVNPKSKSYDTYHPHFHCILAVNTSYFKSRDYMKQAEWLELWRKAMQDPEITQVDVRRLKPKKGEDGGDAVIAAVCEAAKYTVKSADYIFPWDWELSCDAVAVLDRALANRRLVAYGGAMKEWHKKLNLDDEIDGNLIEDGETSNGELLREMCATWNVGYQQYVILD